MFGNGNEGYGGYEGGGGFDVSGFGGTGETPQADKKGMKRTDRIFPVAVRQILDSPDNMLKINQMDAEAQMVKLVGIVKKINRTSVKVIYTLEDNSGTIDGVHWLDVEADENFVVPVVENTYCTMVGSVRNTAQHTQKHVMVFQIFPITDLNEVTAHTLQVIHIFLKSEQLSQTQPMGGTAANTSVNGTVVDNFNSGADLTSGFKLTPMQTSVLQVLMKCDPDNEVGISIDEIMDSLTNKITKKQLENTLAFLCNEGHAYSTNDDVHFKAIDGL